MWSHIVGLKKWILSLFMHIFFLHIFLWESSPILGLGHPTKWDKSCFLSHLGRPILHSSPGLKEEEKLKKSSQKCQSWAQGKLKKSSLNQWVGLCRGCVWQGGFRNVLYSTLECVLYRGGIKTTLVPLQSSLLQSTANCKKKNFFPQVHCVFIRQEFLVPFASIYLLIQERLPFSGTQRRDWLKHLTYGQQWLQLPISAGSARKANIWKAMVWKTRWVAGNSNSFYILDDTLVTAKDINHRHTWLRQYCFSVSFLFPFIVWSWQVHVFTSELLRLRMLCIYRSYMVNWKVISF